MIDSVPDWVKHASALPVAFAQVREDPRIDQHLVDQLRRDARICMVASGGCTAAMLATSPNVATIHLVDPNPSQLALARLKLRLLELADPDRRLALLGHARMQPEERRSALAVELAELGLQPDSIGPPQFIATVGPDYAGRYERCFAALQAELGPHREELDAVLGLVDPAEQTRRVAPHTDLGRGLDHALDSVMSLPNLVALFGEGATRNPVEPFSRHFARRLRHVFATLPARQNSFLSQMLRGRGPAEWFTRLTDEKLPQITWELAFMADALRSPAHQFFDLVHLSNILDWLSPGEATATLEAAARALRAGGSIIIRQLNSTLDIPACGKMFDWDRSEAASLHAADRSFFYRALYIGRKR